MWWTHSWFKRLWTIYRLNIMTVKELKEFLKDIPDNTEILVAGYTNPDLVKVKYEYSKTPKGEKRILAITA